MFEPSSAMTLIAEDGEFRFARFYIVCEAVPLGTLGNPLIVCGLSDTFRGVSKRGRDTESDAKIRQEEMLTFFSNEFPSAFHQKLKDMVFFAYYFSHQKGIVCFKWAAPSFLRFFMTGAKRSHIFSERS